MAALLLDHLDTAGREQLLDLARAAIGTKASEVHSLKVDLGSRYPYLTQKQACFVTLKQQGRLRGCVGSLRAWRSLLDDVTENARAAAFNDRRFAPVSMQEVPMLEIELSVLSEPEALQVDSEVELLAVLRPSVDGLILEDAGHRATYLPSVWQQLPDPASFVRELKVKAGFARDYWSPGIRFYRYETMVIKAESAVP